MQPTQLRVAVLCTGNICRSPMAEVALRQMVQEDPNLVGRVEVTSAGTANWHVGSAMDPRARRALDRAGLVAEGSAATYADPAYLDGHDIVVVMTRDHLSDVHQRLTNTSTEVILLRNLLEPGLNLDVEDPYYGDESSFDQCLELIRRAGRRLTLELRRRLDADSSEV